MDDDQFTVRCIKPYKKHVEPHVVRPWVLANSPRTVFVTLRNAEDKVVNITVKRIAHLVFGDAIYDMPPVPCDLIPVSGFPNFAFSCSENAVYQIANWHTAPFTTRKVPHYDDGRGGFVCRIRDVNRHMRTMRLDKLRRLAKGVDEFKPIETFDENLPDFMKGKREKGKDSYKRRKYRSRRLAEPVSPDDKLLVQGAGPEPEETPPEPKTRHVAVSSVATIIVPEKSTERRIF